MTAQFAANDITNLQALVRQEADLQGVDAALVDAIVQAESSYRPDAINPEPTGQPSYGLMQLQLSTARDMAGDPTLQPEALFDPGLNLRLGIMYLKLQLHRYQGDIESAISAYNAGTARVVGQNPDGSRRFANQGYVSRVLNFLGVAPNTGATNGEPTPSVEMTFGTPVISESGQVGEWWQDWRIWVGVPGVLLLVMLMRSR